MHRGELRDKSAGLTSKRKEEDEELIKEMERTADIIIDSNKDLNEMLASILKALKTKEELRK